MATDEADTALHHQRNGFSRVLNEAEENNVLLKEEKNRSAACEKKEHHTHTHLYRLASLHTLVFLCAQGVCKNQLLLGDHSFAFLFACFEFSGNLCDVNAVHIESHLQPLLSHSHCRFCNEVQISLSEM